MLEILKIYIESNRKYIIIFALVLLQIQVYLHITRSDVIYEQQTQFLRRFKKSIKSYIYIITYFLIENAWVIYKYMYLQN